MMVVANLELMAVNVKLKDLKECVFEMAVKLIEMFTQNKRRPTISLDVFQLKSIFREMHKTATPLHQPSRKSRLILLGIDLVDITDEKR